MDSRYSEDNVSKQHHPQRQADGVTPLDVIGEVHVMVNTRLEGRYRIDEIEILKSIYGDEFHVDDESMPSYYIDLHNNSDPPTQMIRVQVSLPPSYPATDPPKCTLSAPWLQGERRQALENELHQIFLEHPGESILYFWLEKVREYVQNVAYYETEDSGTGSLGDDLVASWSDGAAPDYRWQKSLNVKPAEEISCPEIYHSEILSDRKSKFQSHLSPVNKKEQVDLVMAKLKENRKIAAATHNIIAYRICVPNSDIMYKSSVDDGEFGAGQRLSHLLDILGAENVMVVVTRWYGGIHLGPDRFKHINNMARELLQRYGYIKEKSEKKGPRTSKKTR